MSDERTVPASTRRRTLALEQGSRPRSALLTSSGLLLAITAYSAWSGADLLLDAAAWLELRLCGIGSVPGELVSDLQSALWAGVGLAGGAVLVAFAAAAAADVLQTGLHIHPPHGVSPPLHDWQRVFRGLRPSQLLGELARWVMPLGVLVYLLTSRWGVVAALTNASPAEVTAQTGELLSSLLQRLVLLLLMLGAAHWAWRRWIWERSLWMTPDELRDEQRLDGGRRGRR